MGHAQPSVLVRLIEVVIMGDLSLKTFNSLNQIAILSTGSTRYNLSDSYSDQDYVILTQDITGVYQDHSNRTDYFVYGISAQYDRWAHPLFIGSLTGKFYKGNDKLRIWLEKNRINLPYSNPCKTCSDGIAYIAKCERENYKTSFKQALRTSMILKHISDEYTDPFTFDEEERDLYAKYHRNSCPNNVKKAIYNHYLSSDVIHKLTMMPTHLELRDEYFSLLKELGYCDRVFPFSNKKS